jgi:hypothetical protein
MAQKKKSAQPKPRAAEPRMYGDGQPSQAAQPVTTATTEPAARTAGVTPRTTAARGVSGSYSRVDRITDYSYVKADLRRLGITAAAILGVLVVLGVVIG